MGRPGRLKKPKAPRPAVVDAYLTMLATERGAALNTCRAYEHDLTDVCAFLKTRNKDIKTAATADLTEYLSALGNRANAKNKGGGKTAGRTITRRITVLHQFFHFLVVTGQRQDDPTAAIETPRVEPTVQRVLEEKDVRALIDTAQKHGGRRSLRLVALLEILYSTGLRVSELVGLPLTAIDAERQYLTVKSKTGERRAPLSESAQKAMKAYMDIYAGILAQSKWLFPSRMSESGHLTRQRFSKLLEDLSRTAGLDPKNVSPTILRHSFTARQPKE